ncbi:hypothetical protein IFM89_028393 [Coptis chinensis]|uniref:Uncharacterized protein n=1 Tax=Coptis chinensis TaxID=261450 RepID=A0A835H8W8_9MAGN|nr:hypothetical protein IFM89_028393 [Coptis chinensis]
MEMVTSMNLCDSSKACASPSPGRVNINHLAVQFYSMATSPTGGGLDNVPLVSYSGSYREVENSRDSSVDADFEFGTGQHSMHHDEQQKHQPQYGQHIFPMAFADELFCDGQVMPLKPPPRLQYVDNNIYSNRCSSGSSPTSPSSVLKGPFRRWSFNKNNTHSFDPFMAALENVSKEAAGINNIHRRARSLSPLRTPLVWFNSNESRGTIQHQKKETGFESQQPDEDIGSIHGEQIEHKRSTSPRPSHKRSGQRPTKPILLRPTFTNDEGLIPGKQVDPTRLTSARQVNRVRSGLDGPTKPTPTTLPEPTVKTSESLDATSLSMDVSLTLGEQIGKERQPWGTQVTQVRSSRDKPIKPTPTTLPGHTVQKTEPLSKGAIGKDGSFRKGSDRFSVKENSSGKDGSFRKVSNRFSVKENSVKNASEGRPDNEDKLRRSHNEALKGSPDLRNLSFRGIHKAHYSDQKQLAKQDLRRKTLIPYKAQCMLVCLGFGHHGLRDLN